MEPVQPEASVATTGKGIKYIGEHAYGYSGIINSSGETTYLEFSSGSGYILAQIQPLSEQANGDDFKITFYFNDVVIGVANMFFFSNSTWMGSTPWNLLIPPQTKVKITIENINSADEWAVMLTGRVYGAE